MGQESIAASGCGPVVEGTSPGQNVPASPPRHYINALDSLGEIVFETDQSGSWVYLNTAWQRITGFAVVNTLGRCFIDFVHPDDRQWMLDEFLPLIERTKDECLQEVRFVAAGGGFRNVEFFAKPVLDETGEVMGAIGTIKDLTEKKKIERELKKAHESAEESANSKSQFLAMMSHEIRTPMNAILGITDLVMHTRLDPEQKRHLDMVKSSAGSLLEIINDVLDFAKLEAGKLTLDVAPFDLRETLGQTLAPMLFKAMEKKLELLWNVDDLLPTYLVGDALRLRQVILSLVGNALKFTAQGSVRVDVVGHQARPTDVPAAGADKICLHFTVTDTGIGIPPEQQDKLFSAFSQLDASTTRKYGGTGLGLIIASKMAALMNGRIWVDSDVGKGSRFNFTAWLQIGTAPAAVATAQKSSALAPVNEAPKVNLKVLVAEDNTVNQHLITHMLKKLGHTPRVVENGREAVDAWDREYYDIILMDVQMPGMSGLEATAEIRLREKQRGTHIPILAVTANAIKGDREMCLDAGMDEYVTKPVRRNTLEEAISKLMTQYPSQQHGNGTSDNSAKLMNYAAALEGADNDAELLASIMEMFLKRTPETMDKLKTAIAAADADAATLHAHSLKGVLRTLVVPEVEAMAHQLERCARDKNLVEARMLSEALPPYLERLSAELRVYLQAPPQVDAGA